LAVSQISDFFTIKITDVNGKEVLNAQNIGEGQIIWNTAKTRNGLYFYTINNQKGLSQSGRIVVIK
jgi:Secretion system C-terminal sorting domain